MTEDSLFAMLGMRWRLVWMPVGSALMELPLPDEMGAIPVLTRLQDLLPVVLLKRISQMTEFNIRKYYREHRYSCASVILRASVDMHWLNLSEQVLVLADHYCTSYHTEDFCGAYGSALVVLYYQLLHYPEYAVLAPDISASFGELFREWFGGLKCSSIRLSCFDNDVGCLHTLTQTMDIMGEFIDAFQSNRIAKYTKI